MKAQRSKGDEHPDVRLISWVLLWRRLLSRPPADEPPDDKIQRQSQTERTEGRRLMPEMNETTRVPGEQPQALERDCHLPGKYTTGVGTSGAVSRSCPGCTGRD